MPAYATQADMEAYVLGWSTDDPEALDWLLEQASRRIDELFPVGYPNTTGSYIGLKLDPSTWDAWESLALARATAAQAYYMWQQRERASAAGDPNGIQPAARRVKGPVFEVEYADTPGTARFSPDVAGELAPIRHRRSLTARATA